MIGDKEKYCVLKKWDIQHYSYFIGAEFVGCLLSVYIVESVLQILFQKKEDAVIQKSY